MALGFGGCITPPVVAEAHNDDWTLEQSSYPRDATVVEVRGAGVPYGCVHRCSRVGSAPRARAENRPCIGGHSRLVRRGRPCETQDSAPAALLHGEGGRLPRLSGRRPVPKWTSGEQSRVMTDSSQPMRDAIESADAGRMARLIADDADCATRIISWGPGGKNQVPPLHFVCDAVFRKLSTQQEALAMAEVLLGAGEDPNRRYAKSGDTFLIAAASLGAEEVGVRLLKAGADHTAKGLFGASALHWAVMMGLPELVSALIAAGAALDEPDTEHKATPIQWALHAWTGNSNGYREKIPEAARRLVAAGVTPDSGMDEMLAVNPR